MADQFCTSTSNSFSPSPLGPTGPLPKQVSESLPPAVAVPFSPDLGVVLNFLRRIHPDQRVALAAIEPVDSSPAIHCRTVATETDVAAFVTDYQARGWNIYFELNAVRPDLGTARASKHDMVAATALHVDVDPPKPCPDLAGWHH